MDYFDLPSAVQAQPSGPASSSTGKLPPGTQTNQTTEHAVIVLDDGQESIPTPVGTPLDHPGAISISTAFHPSFSVDGNNPDVVLISGDGVQFFVHRQRLLAVSSNAFGGLIKPEPSVVTPVPTPPVAPQTIRIPFFSHVANVILHTVYGLSCVQYLPTLEAVDAALDALTMVYGVSIEAYTVPHMPLYELILSFAPFRPLDAYALAARHSLEDLCVTISSHLLAYDLGRISDSAAQKMGPVYLKRLFLLHQSRLAALRSILFKPPPTHRPAPGCSEEMQQQLIRAWAFAVAQLVWDVLPSVSTSALQALLEPIGLTLNCPSCGANLQQRIQEVLFEWSMVKRTI